MQFRNYDCTHSVAPLFKIGKADIYGGSKHEYRYFVMQNEDMLGITLCLSKYDEIKIEPVLLRSGKLPDDLLKFTVSRYPGDTYMGIDWPDMGIPNLPKNFWLPFVDYINKSISKAVYVHCMGGHGRTGTALAIMAQLAGVGNDDPVKYLRKVYCKNIVESQEQIDYIGDVLGMVLLDKPAQKFGSQGATADSSMSWEKDYAGSGDSIDQADSIIDLIEEAKGVHKMIEHDATQKELWEDESVYYGDGHYWTAWGGKLHKKYEKAVAKMNKIKKIVEKEAK